MSIRASKLKAAFKKYGVSPIVSVVGAIIGILPSILKKKKYCLWYKGTNNVWMLKAGPFSHRQCKKTQGDLVSLGTYIDDRFTILRFGVNP